MAEKRKPYSKNILKAAAHMVVARHIMVNLDRPFMHSGELTESEQEYVNKVYHEIIDKIWGDNEGVGSSLTEALAELTEKPTPSLNVKMK